MRVLDAGAVFPDARQIIPYAVRLWFYGSAAMFTVDRFDALPPVGDLVRANPLYITLDLYRTLLLDGTMPDADAWGTLAAWALGTALVGLVFFWRGEVSYGRG